MTNRSQNAGPPAGILYRAPVYGPSGYADENLGVLMELAGRDFPVQLLAEGLQSDTGKLLPGDMRTALARMQQFAVDPGRSVFYQCVPANMLHSELAGFCNIGRTTFETDRLPDGWAERCEELDEIWVPSEFNRETFARGGVEEDKLHVMPEGIDTELFRPGLSPMPVPERRGFVFLSVFDFQQRKGPDILLRAFANEFRADEDVTLLLKITKINHPGLDVEAWLAWFIECELGMRLDAVPPIILLNGLLPRAHLPRLYAAADAFVLPTRGEGWGRPYGEALSCGVPVIATRWGGQLDFLNDRNSFLIDLDGVVPTSPRLDLEVFAGHCWAQPSVDHLRQLMRYVFGHRDEARARADVGRVDMVREWDARRVASLFADEFARLLDGLPSRASADAVFSAAQAGRVGVSRRKVRMQSRGRSGHDRSRKGRPQTNKESCTR